MSLPIELEKKVETALRRAGGIPFLAKSPEGRRVLVKLAVGECLHDRTVLAARASEIATDAVDQMFEDIDPQTHEEISIAIFDAIISAHEERD